jgi:endoglucanase
MPEFGFDYDLLVDLTEASGVPGYEDRIRGLVREALEPHVDRLRSDAMGNVVGTVDGATDHEVVVAAHVDELRGPERHRRRVRRARRPRRLGPPRPPRPAGHGPHRGRRSPRRHRLVPAPHPGRGGARGGPEVEDVHVDPGLDGETATERVAVGDLVTMAQRTEVVW